jgi:hypothetical protein
MPIRFRLHRPSQGVQIEDLAVGPAPVQDCGVGSFGCSIGVHPAQIHLIRSARLRIPCPTRAELDGLVFGPACPGFQRSEKDKRESLSIRLG